MRKRRLLVGLILPAALASLVGALATLQYRWVGQVSEAEREQLRESLDRRAREFTDDFDREIGRVYLQLQPEPAGLDPAKPESFATKFDQWKTASRFPEIVKAVYFARRTSDGFDLFHFVTDSRTFQRVDWPASLEPVRSRLAGTTERITPPAAGSPPRIITYASTPVVIEIPAIVIPVPAPLRANVAPRGAPDPKIDMFVALRFSHSHIVVEFDGSYLKQTLVPALAARHFPETGSDPYRVSIIDSKAEPILARGLADGQRLDSATADVSAPFFGLRLETLKDKTLSLVAPRGRLEREGTTITTVGPLSTVMNEFSVRVEQRATATVTGSGAGAAMHITAGGGWKILVQHAAGSLDAAVADVRRRNLWLSFSILAVLAAGVGLIVINARRSERLAAQQMDFVATVSHELRTPLAVIRSAAQNLSAGVVHEAGQARRYGDLIEGEGQRLTDMVEQVLEYAGLSGNRRLVPARPVEVGALVSNVVSSCASLFEAGRFQVAVDLPADLPAVMADEGAIRRALHNLVTNAVKYAADGRWLGVAARKVAIRGGDEVQIALSDHGRGIAADDLAHIFEPFYRSRYAVERQIHGNGLGLSLVKRIAEVHGGRITVTSSHGVGSTFTLHLPAAPTAAAANPIAEPATGGAGPTV